MRCITQITQKMHLNLVNLFLKDFIYILERTKFYFRNKFIFFISLFSLEQVYLPGNDFIFILERLMICLFQKIKQ